MSENTDPGDRPDVEAIVAHIREQVRSAENALAAATEAARVGPSVEELEEAERGEANLYDNLHAANSTCRIGLVPETPGLKGKARTKVYGLIEPLVAELNTFHANVVRSLNKLVKIFDGQDTQVSSELLMKTQRRVDLLAQLCSRLEAIEDLNLDERLRSIEERLQKLEGREPS